MTNYNQKNPIQKKNEERVLEICPHADNRTGIYIFTRYEGDFRFAYVGQAKRLLRRIAQHFSGYQHIDLSIKNHGLYDKEKNPNGWVCSIAKHCREDELDYWERWYIAEYANKGFQMRNKINGGQAEGKFAIAERKPAKGYYDGINQGYKKVQKEMQALFLHLTVKKQKDTKYADKALEKFNTFLKGES